MKLIIRQMILATYFVLAISASNAYATTFGDSCSAPPLVDATGYLGDDTAYGYIKNRLDMKTYVTDGCSPDGDFKFCIKGSNGAACEQVSMPVGSENQLKNLSTNPDIGGDPVLGGISLKVRAIGDQACLMMPTSRGMMPLICRDTTPPPRVAGEALEAICRNIDESCYSTNTKTQSLMSFTGLTVHCLRNTLDKVLYLGNECPVLDNESALSSLRPFAGFQDSMKMAVRAALILYVMFYGFKLVMNHEYAEFNKITLFLIKFLFVAYFAVGLGTKTLENGREVSHNGVTELALPIFTELTASFTEMVFFAGGSQGLCNFDPDKYEAGYRFYRLWDAIDCRVGYYLGMQILYNIGDALSSMNGETTASTGRPISMSGSGSSSQYDALSKTGSLGYFIVMCGFFLGGQILIVIFGLVFVVMLISVLMYFVTAYLVCLVTLYVLAYVSPIFVPMVLFERTKGYFDSWLKVVISCILQPAVIGAFVAMLLTMYDSAIYGNCEFQRYDYTSNDFSFSTFELRLPDGDDTECRSSLGYKLLAYYNGAGWESKNMLLFVLKFLSDTLDLITSLIYVVIYMIVFYFFIQSVNEFAADLTGGPSLSAVTASPTAVVDKMMGAMATMGSMMRGGNKGGGNKGAGKQGGGGGKDMMSARRDGGDRISAPREGGDRISAPRGGGSGGEKAGGNDGK